jgi:mRNA-degrading endonuclease HigB of HigAB toxin-antitoxin module
MDNSGNALIVWYQDDGSRDQIFKSEYRDGEWIHPADLDDNISPDGEDADAYYPQVAMDDNGNALIVWEQFNGSNYQVFKSEYRDGEWTHPADLDDHISPDGQDAEEPHAAMDNNGNALIVWMQHNGTRQQIYKSEYRDGEWTHPTDLFNSISPDAGSANSPQVAMDDNGNALIVWPQSDGSNYQVFKSEYRDGAWIHPATLSGYINPNGEDVYDPQVAMDNSGNAVIVWQQSDGSTQQIYKSEYRDGAWTHPEDLDDNISQNGQDAEEPQVAMDGSGNAVIVWEQSDGINWQIFKSEYRDGVWTHPEDLDDHISQNGQDAYPSQVAMDDSGNAVIVWNQPDGINWQIFKSEYRFWEE